MEADWIRLSSNSQCELSQSQHGGSRNERDEAFPVERLSPGLSAFWATVFLLFMLATQKALKSVINKTGEDLPCAQPEVTTAARKPKMLWKDPALPRFVNMQRAQEIALLDEAYNPAIAGRIHDGEGFHIGFPEHLEQLFK